MANGGNRPNRPLRPRGGGGPAGRRRRVVIDQGAQRPNAREQRQARQDAAAQSRAPKAPVKQAQKPLSPANELVMDQNKGLGGPDLSNIPGATIISAEDRERLGQHGPGMRCDLRIRRQAER